ncbi:RibD family protein [Kribbella sp. NPDC058245]|uniref:RibD family protein n=1 Tax=Kribbella sp. NPDC058245 TaxID=3346399 RepID=UPI0036EF0B7C
MPNRPYVVLSAASSIDGYIDDATDQRLFLSNDEDFDRVDEVRASVDAILVGANTIRVDNPRLLVRSQERRDRRVAASLPFSPAKVTITSTGDLSPAASFFTEGDIDKLVYTSAFEKTAATLGEVATVIEANDLHSVLRDLGDRGIERLMVEGGTTMHTQFLTAGLADELHLVIAPFFVGDPAAASFVAPGNFPHNSTRRMDLTEVRQIGDVVLLRYLLERAADD